MPCRFTEEELDEVIRHPDTSGNASQEEVKFFLRDGDINYIIALLKQIFI